ncbi:MAG TPA: transposase family protein [Urbifossiella sp.]|nr:transposase family protein [Urbifossiella sp.]
MAAAPRRKPRGQDRPPEDRRYNRAFSRRRIVVGHATGRVRRFRSHVNRHRRKGHAARVRAVAGLVNRMLPSDTA